MRTVKTKKAVVSKPKAYKKNSKASPKVYTIPRLSKTVVIDAEAVPAPDGRYSITAEVKGAVADK